MKSSRDCTLLAHRMSRRALVAGTFFAGAALAIPMRQAMAFAPGDPVMTTTDVNLRGGPGLRFDVIRVLPAGTSGIIDGIPDPNDADGYIWYGFELADNTTGYVAGEFLASAGPAPNFPVGSRVIVTTDVVNVRSQPGLSGTVVTVAFNGATGSVQQSPTYADGYYWIQVAFEHLPEYVGWLATDFLELYSDYHSFNVGDRVYVNSGPLNFRAKPGLNGPILHTLQTNDTGQIVAGPDGANGDTWWQIEIATGEVGWVVQDFLSTGNPPSADVQVGDTIQVVDGPLNIRSGPGSSYDVVDIAATGAIATVVDGPTTADGYTWIEINGNLLAVGWVAFEFCAVV